MNGISFLKDNLNLEAYSLQGIEFRELKFDKGESYRGGWRDDTPEGEGIYTWNDGSVYEGSWHEGLKHGWGKYTWPNGAQYKGEWSRGLFQGYGTFRSQDGSYYQGGWSQNLKHGLGRKTYVNGDFYEGLWRHGKAEGPGRYVWHQGNVFDGEWRSGKMHGQGTLRWRTGERYDGEWREGLEDGIGVFTWQDGSTYEGFWVQGRKEGVGVFRPATESKAAHPPNESSAKPSTESLGELDLVVDQGSVAHYDRPIDSPTVARGPLARDISESGRRNSDIVYVCEYQCGRLEHEEALTHDDVEIIFGPMQHQLKRKRRLRRRGKRRQESMGETIYKGHRSYDLMLNLQLGIRYTLTTLSKVPRPKDLTESHFLEKVWLRFPRNGSEVTPPHPSNDFKWKDYCPEAFRRLRDVFGINTSEYLLSICGDQALRELPSPGKSGSVFFISHDDQYMIKTMRKEEIKLLLVMLPKYVAHVSSNPATMLLRFFGVHRVKPSHGLKVRFVVMNNVFRTEVPLHSKYDLKGSTHGRTVGSKMSSTAVRKDLDLDVRFKVGSTQRARLMDQLAADCAFLEEMKVMDYSLLLGVHYRSHGETSASPVNTDKEDEGAYETAEEDGTAEGDRETPDAASAAAQEEAVGHRRTSSDLGSPRQMDAENVDDQLVLSMHELHLDRVSICQDEPDRSNSSLNCFKFWGRQQHHRSGQLALEWHKASNRQPSRLEQPTPADQVQPLHHPGKQPPGGAPFVSASAAAAQTVQTAALPIEADSPPAEAVVEQDQPTSQLQGSHEQGFDSHCRNSFSGSQQPSSAVLADARYLEKLPGGPAGGQQGVDACSSTLGVALPEGYPLPFLEGQQPGQGRTAGRTAETRDVLRIPNRNSSIESEAHCRSIPPALIRWRSDAVRLPELQRIPNFEALHSDADRRLLHLGDSSFSSASSRGKPSPSAGPSVIASLPPIPAQSSFSAASHEAAVSGSAPLPGRSRFALEEQARSANALPPRRATMPSQLAYEDGGYSSSPSSARVSGVVVRAGSELGSSLSRTCSAPATSFEAYASAGVKLRGGVAGLVKCGPGVIDAPVSFKHMAHTGARVSGGVLRRLPSNVDLTSPEAALLATRIHKNLERPVSDRLLQDLLKLARYKMLGQNGGTRQFRAPTMVLAARCRRNSSLLDRSASDDDTVEQPGPEQPGLNLQAVAISNQVAQQPEDVILFCGIIDFLQEYNLRKMLEHNFKAVVQDGRAISVVEPRVYSKRFLKFLSGVFVSRQESEDGSKPQHSVDGNGSRVQS